MRPVPDRPLVALPPQPGDVAWPTDAWTFAAPAEVGADADRLDALLDELVDDGEHPTLGRTYAAAVVARGRLVAERYGQRPVRDLRSLGEDPPMEQLGPDDELLSWSMAKSIANLAVGVAVADGALSLADPVGDPRWTAQAGDPRAAITWDDLLTMQPGLAWTEEYYDVDDASPPDVISMLFGEGAADMAAYAADKPLVHQPGTREAFLYSSGTSNIVCGNLQRVLGLDADAMDRFLHERILAPIGMASARAEFDPAGTFVGSSYLHARLRDWCRFGLLAMRDGAWDDARVVPEGWMDWSRRGRNWDETIIHGAHWWTWDQDETPFGAHGFEGQRVICFPARDVVVVRLGRTDAEGGPALNDHVTAIARCFPTLAHEDS